MKFQFQSVMTKVCHSLVLTDVFLFLIQPMLTNG